MHLHIIVYKISFITRRFLRCCTSWLPVSSSQLFVYSPFCELCNRIRSQLIILGFNTEKNNRMKVKDLLNKDFTSNNRPRSVPELQLPSRAASSICVYSTVPSVPNTGSNPGGGVVQKKNY